ncbi:MAG: magnesium/cobalt transporter CorA [Bacteroidales bacterium]|nr:magnesium/cobalt transporter CorA [Bacteroidales bacterium]MBN2762387.1 magnesium/cobalt transporter CorA [Bacteroidales bacterium]
MTRLYKKDQNIMVESETIKTAGDLTDLIWIDLQSPSLREIEEVENYFGVNIPTRMQQEEIESSSRFIEKDDYIIANSIFLQKTDENQYLSAHVSFVLRDELLITYHEGEVRAFDECVKKISINHKPFSTGNKIFLSLLEIRVDFDADFIECISKQITIIGRSLTAENGTHEELLREITAYQESAMMIRQNIIDKQRVMSLMIKNMDFTEEEKERLGILSKDIDSLVDHTNFLFERLEYLQNTFLGLVNTDQNKIIKIFTLISVIIMPPTFIASLYGMNFRFMPELNWKIGYPLTLLLMIGSSYGTWLFFKRHKWL